jgi:hypothetical protein
MYLLKPTYLYQEQPPPSSIAKDTPHVEKSVGKERSYDIGSGHGHPEDTKAYSHLSMLVEV